MSWLNEFLLQYQNSKVPRLHLADGTTLSVQVGVGIYYRSKRNAEGRVVFTHVEVPYLSTDAPPSWETYQKTFKHSLTGIYAFLPIELVHYFIASHGGIDQEKTYGGAKWVLSYQGLPLTH